MDINTEEINQFNSDGFEHGLWSLRNSDGSLLAEGNFVNGLRQGRWKIHRAEGNYVDDLRHGLWKIHRVDGSYIYGNYVNDIEQGLWIWYYSNDELWSKLYFDNNVMEGEEVIYEY